MKGQVGYFHYKVQTGEGAVMLSLVGEAIDYNVINYTEIMQ